MKAIQSASRENAMQQCTLAKLRFSLAAFTILYVGGLFFYVDTRNWPVLISWLVLLPCAKWLGLRLSPLTAKWRGYGTLTDAQPSQVVKTPVEVTVYSHNGCPFCPVLRRRLKALQEQMDFTLKEIDLTLKPHVAASKGIQTVPVVDVGDARLFGNATTERLAEFIAGAKTSDAPLPAV
jgi:glutaredoxin